MPAEPMSDHESWPVARFPSRCLRQEFLDQISLWNRVEGLPKIDTEPLFDGVRVRYFSRDARPANVAKLIETFGGFVVLEGASRIA